MKPYRVVLSPVGLLTLLLGASKLVKGALSQMPDSSQGSPGSVG